jgi:murein DD-endopeptidase MepM/ murein hydrolase activator NlpD
MSSLPLPKTPLPSASGARFGGTSFSAGLPTTHGAPTKADAEAALAATLWKQVLQSSGAFGDKSGWGGMAADVLSEAVADAIGRDGPALVSSDKEATTAAAAGRFELPPAKGQGHDLRDLMHSDRAHHGHGHDTLPKMEGQLLALVDGPAHISSHFGPRADPLGHTHRHHDGVDIAAPVGAAIRAAGSGVVTWVGPRGGYGNLVEITHTDGRRTRYAHASRIHVEKGQRIQGGEVIAEVGQSGRATGPHLHFEVRGPRGSGDAARPVDPAAINLNRALKTYGARADSSGEHRLLPAGEPHG